jgi:hypothetical protein
LPDPIKGEGFVSQERANASFQKKTKNGQVCQTLNLHKKEQRLHFKRK